MNINTTNLNLLWSSLIIDQLISRGITRFFVSPGYRCAPLLYILNQRKDIQVFVISDERSASYYALGAIQASKLPCALICTSGTAVANYFPALIEAFHASLPLVVLTSDRPFDAWDVDANQSINQKNIYGSFVFSTLNLPNPSLDIDLYHLISKLQNTLNQLFHHLKPIHINLPLKEPLEDQVMSIPIPDSYLKPLKLINLNDQKNLKLGQLIPIRGLVDFSLLLKKLAQSERPLLVLGQLENDEITDENLLNIEKFIYKLQDFSWPIFIDITSSLKYRFISPSIIYLDHPMMINSIIKEYKPDLILHLGGRLVSNNYYRFLSQNLLFEIQVAFGIDNKDPASRVRERIPLRVTNFCQQFNELESISLENLNSNLLESIKQKIIDLNQKIKTIIDESEIFSYSKLVNLINKRLRDDDSLVLGNSTCLRAFDQYFFSDKTIKAKIISHRGVSGIEGFVSTTRGYYLAEGGDKRVLLVLGDISLLHDFSALLHLKKNENIKIIVINNQRGGIFSTLPIKNHEGFLNSLVESPHDIIFSKVCKELPINIGYCDNFTSAENILEKAFNENDKEAWLIEAFIDHEKDIAEYEKIKTLKF